MNLRTIAYYTWASSFREIEHINYSLTRSLAFRANSFIIIPAKTQSRSLICQRMHVLSLKSIDASTWIKPCLQVFYLHWGSLFGVGITLVVSSYSSKATALTNQVSCMAWEILQPLMAIIQAFNSFVEFHFSLRHLLWKEIFCINGTMHGFTLSDLSSAWNC